ncbi:MAG: PAS domain-containing protein, partial [Clostridia bacterium]|nr:PAS domain-containing protein [Clostridia bacterium]
SPLENEAYDELGPLLTRMDRQNSQIRSHLKALEQARTEMSAIMANMREGMLLIDDRNKVLSINESAAAIFDVNAAECIGRSICSVIRDAQLNELVIAAAGGCGGDMHMKRCQRTYHIFVSPVMRGIDVQGAVMLALDVTERFAAEASRREFTANVSHELKTPLTSISGFAEIIRDGIARPEDVQSFAGKIYTEAGRLISLVNDILELSRLDEKQGLGEREMVNIGDMLRDLAEDFSSVAQKKSIDIAVDCDEAQISGYSMLLREMFYNLIDNAIRYTPDGGCVAVKAETQDNMIVCSVSDNGIGIPEEHLEHVFERFYRVDKSHSRETGGTGLGLAIVKHSAEIHGAELLLDSTVGKGTCITVRFKN